MAYHLPPALSYARTCRTDGTTAEPSRLWVLAEGDAKLYNHAMIEAGLIVQKDTGRPFPSCTECGWSP